MLFTKVRFLKLPSHKRFDYTPLYHDPIKEELEQRIREIEKENDDTAVDANFQATVASHYDQIRSKKDFSNPNRNRNLRLVVIILALTMLAYWIYF